MGGTTPVILRCKALARPHLLIEASDGNQYWTDLSRFESVGCFPSTDDEWQTVSIDSYGLALAWSTRFEVHVDQADRPRLQDGA